MLEKFVQGQFLIEVKLTESESGKRKCGITAMNESTLRCYSTVISSLCFKIIDDDFVETGASKEITCDAKGIVSAFETRDQKQNLTITFPDDAKDNSYVIKLNMQLLKETYHGEITLTSTETVEVSVERMEKQAMRLYAENKQNISQIKALQQQVMKLEQDKNRLEFKISLIVAKVNEIISSQSQSQPQLQPQVQFYPGSPTLVKQVVVGKKEK